MITGAIAGAVLVYPIFLLLASGSVPLVLLGFLIGMPLVQAAMYGPLAAFISEMFTAGACLLSALVVALAKETSRRDLTAVS